MIPGKQMARCPFNKAHTFAREKFIFHITRCKDKEKVIHLYKKCQFDPMHYVLKEEIQMHECCCPKRQESIELETRLKKQFRESLRQERLRNQYEEQHQQVAPLTKREEIQVKLQCQDDVLLQDCEECQAILKKYKVQIMESKNEKLKKFILKYDTLANEE